jgi:hypothetical protein
MFEGEKFVIKTLLVKRKLILILWFATKCKKYKNKQNIENREFHAPKIIKKERLLDLSSLYI